MFENTVSVNVSLRNAVTSASLLFKEKKKCKFLHKLVIVSVFKCIKKKIILFSMLWE